MKKIIFIILFLTTFQLSGQIKKTDVLRFEAKTTTIILPENDTIATAMKKAFEDHWTFTKKIVFVLESEIDSTKLPSPFITLDVDEFIAKTYQVESSNVFLEQRNHRTGETQKIPWGTTMNFVNPYYTHLGFATKLKLGFDEPKWGVGFERDATFSYNDFVKIIDHFQFKLNEVKKRGSYLKAWNQTKQVYGKELGNMTLLIDTNLLKKDFPLEKIEKFYPYKFELTSKESIEQVVLENDETKAYISVIEERPGLWVQYIINTGNGKIYTHRHLGVQTKQTLANKSMNESVSVSDFKSLSSKVK